MVLSICSLIQFVVKKYKSFSEVSLFLRLVLFLLYFWQLRGYDSWFLVLCLDPVFLVYALTEEHLKCSVLYLERIVEELLQARFPMMCS